MPCSGRIGSSHPGQQAARVFASRGDRGRLRLGDRPSASRTAIWSRSRERGVRPPEAHRGPRGRAFGLSPARASPTGSGTYQGGAAPAERRSAARTEKSFRDRRNDADQTSRHTAVDFTVVRGAVISPLGLGALSQQPHRWLACPLYALRPPTRRGSTTRCVASTDDARASAPRLLTGSSSSRASSRASRVRISVAEDHHAGPTARAACSHRPLTQRSRGSSPEPERGA